MPSNATYRFNGYRLVPDQRLLLVGNVPVRLGGRAFDLLVVLIEGRDRTLGKAELFARVWPNLVVEENNLQVQVAGLRKLLGHPAIGTVPGRGYRFTLPVSVEGDDEGVSPAPPAEPRPDESARSLPWTPTPLYGRDAELCTLGTMLGEHPLVTVAGAGGIGKTRLAQGAASDARPRHPDGVWWVNLTTLRDATLIAAEVGRVMDLQLQGVADVVQTVVAALHGRAALIVLDNAEHLLDGVGTFVAEVRSRAPTIRLLVTSQEVLRAVDEHVFRPGPLALPRDDDDLAAVGAAGAVALFVARASAADPRFTLTNSNRSAVVEICRRLDGIPLAIELAAARVPLLGVHALSERLDARFAIFTAGTRASMPRHQTLRAALDWSHGLLSADEQVVFRRLGVFAGSFTLDAAQDLCDDQRIDRWDVLEHLGALVDKSLVVAEGDAIPRYKLLETTRMYALERLAQAGESEAMLRRHALEYLSFAERWESAVRGHGRGAQMVARLAEESDNILSAVDWCGRDDDPQMHQAGLRFMFALRDYWEACGLLQLGVKVSTHALARADTLPVDQHRFRALGPTGWMLTFIGDFTRAKALADELILLAQTAQDHKALAVGHRLSGWIAESTGHPDDAEAHYVAALAAGHAAGNAREVNGALAGLVRLLADRGKLAEAEQRNAELIERLRDDGHVPTLIIGLLDAGRFAVDRGDVLAARALLREAAALTRQTGSWMLEHDVVEVTVSLLVRREAWSSAVRLAAANETACRQAGVHAGSGGERRTAEAEAARAALGNDGYAREWATGAAMDREATLALAIAELETP